MKRIFSRKRVVFLAVLAIAAITAVAAYAWFTATGSGSGTAQVGTSTAFQITGTVTDPTGGITPGGPAATVKFDVTNPSNGNQRMDKISLFAVHAYPTAADRTAETNELSQLQCDTSLWTGTTGVWQMDDVTVGYDFPAGGPVNLDATLPNPPYDGSLLMHDNGASQDGCKSAYLTLVFHSN